MEITYKHFRKINFPIFRIHLERLYEEDKVIYIDGLVVDDLNQISYTLGGRRLQTPHALYTIKTSYPNLVDMVQSNHHDFIDYYGFIFKYKKTRFLKVVYHKILEVKRKETCSLLKVQGVNSYYIVPRPPPDGKSWVGLIYVNKKPWLPYDYSESCCKQTIRKF